jgi:hypothetical protein
MLDRVFLPVLSASGRRSANDDAKLESCAFLGPRAGAEVYAGALRDVILPGFEELGVDLGPARARAREHGWA